MQLHQLRYMVAVAEEQGFTRAARRLHVAQPSVSGQLQALERELGAPLFARARGAVSLTAAGEAFLPWARQVLADLDGGQAAVRQVLGLRRGRLALGATPSLTTSLLPPLLAAFHGRHPGIELNIRQAGSRELAASLAEGGLDLAFVIQPTGSERLVTLPLAEEELVLAVPEGHPFAGRAHLGLGDLRDVPLVMFREGYDLRAVTVAACRQAGFEPTSVVDGGEMHGVLALAAAGLGAAVVPSSVVEAGGPLRAVRFAAADGAAALTRTIALARHGDRPRAPAARAFTRHLLERFGAGWPGVPGLRPTAVAGDATDGDWTTDESWTPDRGTPDRGTPDRGTPDRGTPDRGARPGPAGP